MLKALKNAYRETRRQLYWLQRYSKFDQNLKRYLSADKKKSIYRQAYELWRCVRRYRCFPDHYFKYRLYEPNHSLEDLLRYVPDYVSWARLFPKVNRHSSQEQIILNNKIVFNHFMRLIHMPIPKTTLLMLNRTFYDEERNIIGPEEALRRVETCQAGGIFVKYEIGDRGNTVTFLHRKEGSCQFWCGEEAVDMQFLDRMRLRGNYLFEESVVQHSATAAFHRESVNTFRVATQFMPGKGAKVLLCAFRMGKGHAVMDNASKGGIFAGIDTETGALYDTAYDVGGNVYYQHPDSGIVFKGQGFSFMHEIFELCKRGAVMLPTLPSIGWDITYTDQGPVIIEANDNWGLSLFQFPNGGIADILEREWNIRWH